MHSLIAIKTCSISNSQSDNNCLDKEECTIISTFSESGICTCIEGYTRNNKLECVPVDYEMQPVFLRTLDNDMSSEGSETDLRMGKDKKHSVVAVSVDSKEIRLPEREVTLTVSTVPDEENLQVPYIYVWNILTRPKKLKGILLDQKKSTLHISNLSEGFYSFKVTVTNRLGAYGDTIANITVLPKKRVNRLPQVIISPKSQVLSKPLSNTTLDASSSVDDDKIVSWYWKVIAGPLDFHPILPNVSILQLTNLKPGVYLFNLTVTDSDLMSNSTTANITVINETDQPGISTTGDDLLFVPQNHKAVDDIVHTASKVLLGNQSNKLYMQFTKDPLLKISNVKKGTYTFLLKVLNDPANVIIIPENASETNMYNIQKSENHNGPGSIEILDTKNYMWQQISGPNTVIFLNETSAICNATSFPPRLFKFGLRATDELNNTDVDDISLKNKIGESNVAPVANAGGNFTATLPMSVLYLNGSSSYDDGKIVNYTWSRESISLAAGVIVGNSLNEPILILTNLVPGLYSFRLIVVDEQGLISTDIANVIVHPDPLLMYSVQVTIPKSISHLKYSEMNKIVEEIGSLLGNMKVLVRDMKYDLHIDYTILIFCAETNNINGNNALIDGATIVRILKEKEYFASMNGIIFTDIRTTVCQNKCSGHGVCNANTRTCNCEKFWMPSIIYFWGWDESNCDWSVFYVILGCSAVFLLLSTLFWIVCRGYNKSKVSRKKSKVQRYSLIGTQEEESCNFTRTTSLTDSDTDSDVLFESKRKPTSLIKPNPSRIGIKKNALSKVGKKVKT